MAQGSILDEIVSVVQQTVESKKQSDPLPELKARIADMPPCRPFAKAFEGEFGLIAEIKQKSPSMGNMRAENLSDAPAVYRDHPLVHAVSILTEQTYFGMGPDDFTALQEKIGKPALRKDFMIDPYQLYESRAMGADAVLLMSQHLNLAQIEEFASLAVELGMDVLLECYTDEHLAQAPENVAMVGINSRSFSASAEDYKQSRDRKEEGGKNDFTTDLKQFEKISLIRDRAVKVAESGIKPENITQIRDAGFNAALVGTSLLLDPRGIHTALDEFRTEL